MLYEDSRVISQAISVLTSLSELMYNQYGPSNFEGMGMVFVNGEFVNVTHVCMKPAETEEFLREHSGITIFDPYILQILSPLCSKYPYYHPLHDGYIFVDDSSGELWSFAEYLGVHVLPDIPVDKTNGNSRHYTALYASKLENLILLTLSGQTGKVRYYKNGVFGLLYNPNTE